MAHLAEEAAQKLRDDQAMADPLAATEREEAARAEAAAAVEARLKAERDAARNQSPALADRPLQMIGNAMQTMNQLLTETGSTPSQ